MSGQIGTPRVAPVTYALSAGCSGSPGVGLAGTEVGSGVGGGGLPRSRWGETGMPGEREEGRLWGAQLQSGLHLQFHL